VPTCVHVHVMLGRRNSTTLCTGMTLGAIACILDRPSGLVASRSNNSQSGGSMYGPSCTHLQPGLKVLCTFKPGYNDASLAYMYMYVKATDNVKDMPCLA